MTHLYKKSVLLKTKVGMIVKSSVSLHFSLNRSDVLNFIYHKLHMYTHYIYR